MGKISDSEKRLLKMAYTAVDAQRRVAHAHTCHLTDHPMEASNG